MGHCGASLRRSVSGAFEPLTPSGGCEGSFVSVVVPTYNSAKYLALCLRSVKQQGHPQIELIVVDNYSIDNTRKIAESAGAKVLFCKGSQAVARNFGLTHSKGCYVLFLDSDQQLEGTVVEECVSVCSSKGVEAVKIPEVFVGLDFWGKCSAFWKNRLIDVWGPEGGIPRFYKRDILKLSAFKNELRYWEDQELYQRLKKVGVKEAWCKSSVVHYEDGSLQAITRKYLSYGQSITAFKENTSNVPYAQTLNLTFFTMLHVLRRPGRSLKLFFGFCFLFTMKSMCAVFGFLARLVSPSAR